MYAVSNEADSHRHTRRDKTVLSVSRPPRRCELDSRQLKTVADRTFEDWTRSEQSSDSHQTRHRQDRRVVRTGHSASKSVVGCVQVEVPECSAVVSSVSSSGTTTRRHVIYTSLGRSIQLHVLHPNVIDPLTSLGDPVVSPLTHVLLHYQGILAERRCLPTACVLPVCAC